MNLKRAFAPSRNPFVLSSVEGWTGSWKAQPNGTAAAKAHKGFTLLEILIALALLAILMAGLIKITSANTKNLWYLENKTIASTVAANHAVLLRLSKDQPENQDGWDEMAGRRWYWQVRREIGQTPGQGLWRYQIEVFLEGDKQPYAGLSSLVARVAHE